MTANKEILMLTHKLKGLIYVLDNFVDTIDDDILNKKGSLEKNEIVDYCNVLSKSIQEALSIVEDVKAKVTKVSGDMEVL